MKQHLLNNFSRMFILPCVIFLLTLLPVGAMAADVDINLNWDKDATYEWQKEAARFKIRFKIWDGNNNDDWLDYVKLSFDNEVFFYATGNREGESWTTHSLNVTNDCKIGKVYAGNANATPNWIDITNSKITVSWQATGSGDDNKGWAEIYLYPNIDYINKTKAIKIEAKVKDSGILNNEKSYEDKTYVSTTALDYKLEQVIFSEDWQKNGTFPVTVKNLTNGTAYSHTEANIELQTSIDNKTWYTQATHTIKHQQAFEHTFADAKYIKYPKNTKDTIGYKQFAEGVYFRVIAKTDPDADSGDYVQLFTSQSDRTPPLAVLSSRKLAIDHRTDNTLYFTWEVYKPSVSGTISNTWILEEQSALGSWDSIAVINGKNSYELPLAYDEERKAMTKTYRVRNTTFLDGYWLEYMCTNNQTFTYHPYYKAFQQGSLHVDPDAENSTATIDWKMTSEGIWNEDVNLEVEYYDLSSSEVKSKALNSYDRSCTLQGLSECTGYHVSIIASNNEEGYADTISTIFTMPNSEKHKIATFEATHGYYTNKVRLKWEVEKGNTFNHFEITRRAINENTAVSVAELNFNPSNTIYSYEDMDVEAGVIYEYKLIGYTNCTGNTNVQSANVHADAPTCYGFAQSYASVSGRICFNGDQGVPGVDVAVVGTEDFTENYSLEFNGKGSYMKLHDDVIDFRNDNAITFQMYLYPLEQEIDTAYICTHKGVFELALVQLADSKDYALINNIFPSQHIDTLSVDNWHHITMAIHVNKSANSVKADYYSNGALHYSQSHNNVDIAALQAARDSVFIIGAYADKTKNFKGYIDEIRVWNRILDSTYISKTYNRYISGREADLRAYYRCNELGVNVVFDYSGNNDQFNKRDGELSSMVRHSDKIIPSSEQLANKAITDADGNYIINTIPYTTEGQQYEVVPMLGVHQFSPSKQPIYVSSSSTVFNKIDFTDKSSFEVSGKVYYENSNYPVAGCQLQVDGVTCSDNGKPILTNSEGEFTIHVPIGEHYITVVKDGHSFANAGRYPVDEQNQGLLHDFQKPISNLRFSDETKANFVGRIAGGEIEHNKPYGGRQSKANMGQAKIVLRASDLYSLNMRDSVNETFTSFVENTVELPCDSMHPEIQSTAFIGKGANGNLVTIYTDSVTGEFGVKLPPIQYEVDTIIIPSNENIVFDMEAIEDIDLRNVTSINIDTAIYRIDSTLLDLRIVSYVDDLKPLYRSEPTFIVTQKNRVDGSFGESQYVYTDEKTNINDTIPFYQTKEDSTYYTFDYPIFEQLEEYTFSLEGYEEYINYDLPNDPQITKVPLQHTLVTIANEFGVEQAVDTATGKLWEELEEGQLYLDSLGSAEYTFMVGFPNLAPPYTYGLNIKYNIDGKEYLWNDKPLEAIILGNIAGGNQFVTGGPDVVTMILRDPPGSHSSSYFEQGTKSAYTQKWNWLGKVAAGANFKRGRRIVDYHAATGIWTGVGAGTWKLTTQNRSIYSGHDQDHGVNIDIQFKGDHTTTTSTVLNKRVTTSSTVGYIGAMGDVFIGSATNLLFGEAREVMITRDENQEYHITLENVISTGERFTTTFHYSQAYILSSLIPNLKKLRNSFLITGDTSVVIPNKTNEPIYVTPLPQDHPMYGDSATYKVIYPDTINDSNSQFAHADTISVINAQIKAWYYWLNVNEQEKVLAIEQLAYNDENNNNQGVQVNDSTTANFFKKNYSFDSGATITEVIQNSKDTAITMGGDFAFNYRFNFLWTGKLSKSEWNVGLNISLTLATGGTGTDISTATTATGFTLSDQDLNNSYTVDVITSNMSGRGAIFYTRGGQTSCPCAVEERTLFYKPGEHTLAEATVQIENPKLHVENPYAVDVPAGEAAQFTIELNNQSETNTDLMFDLCVLDESNPHGARIAMDGEPIIGNRPVRVKSGEPIRKTIMLRQTDLGVLNYENIQLVLKSQCQGGLQFSGIIADTIEISASFTPSCSNIELEIDDRILNTSTGAVLPIKVKGYNMQYSNFQGFRLQYKGTHDTDWTMIGEWLLNTDGNDKAHLLDAGEITYQFDMSDNAFTPDGTYQFRAITLCNYGTGEIHNESETIEVIKDMTRPMLFGSPSPSSGILTAEGEIAVTFNEDIKAASLTDTRNFQVQGRLNGYKVEHQVAMLLHEGTSAKTTTDMHFSSTPFAINCWFNYTKEGDIITFGNATNKLVIALNNTGQMVVNVNQQTITSTNSVPRDKWCFLSIAYDTIAGGIFTADYILNDEVVNLFDGEVVGQCKSVASQLVLGGNIDAMIHELTVWNYPRNLTEAQSEMYTAKSASTTHLVGYWRMDEGHGNMAEDIAQGHHMQLPNENAWYFDNENIAAQLDGATAMLMDIATASPTPQEDYLMELWFNPAEQTSDAVLLSNGLGFQLGVSAQGALSLKTTKQTLTHAVTPNVWHHVAINHRHNGTTVVYLNGKEVFQVPNESMPNLSADHLVIGADRYRDNDSTTRWSYRNYFKGAVDEVRLWKATLTADYIRQLYRTRIYGNEAGLVAYYPFEKTILDDFAQPIVTFDLADHSEKKVGELQVAAGRALASEQAPPLKSISLLENVKYTYVASERKIVISLNEKAERIEGTTIFLTVQNVEDLNGNNIAEPVKWTVVVNQNQLKWLKKSQEVTTETNQKAEFEVTIVNRGAEREYWQLQNMPTWLQADKEYGELHTLSTETLTFTVSETLPIGTYEETIYLVGNNEIYEPFVVRVTVTGKQPMWIVDPDKYECSMNIIGSLMIEGVVSEDNNDIIAAFINDECVGVASPQYNQRYDKYFVMMDVYSNVSNSEEIPIIFKAYDASTGNTYPIVQLIEPQEDKQKDVLIFKNNHLVGSLDQPLVWDAQNYLEQVIDFNSNWNWVSLYVNPTDTIASSLLESLFPNLLVLKNKISSMIFEGKSFVGKNIIIKAGEKYRAKLSEKKRHTFIGTPVDLTTYQDTISPNWTWIGYPASFTMSITDAFASINPQHGDIVKSKSSFATYSGYEWIGTLTTLVPGQGYLYYSMDKQQKILQFPAQTLTHHIPQRKAAPLSSTFTPVDHSQYPSNMTVIAKVYDGNNLQYSAEVAAFVGEECRGVATSDENGFVCLTIAGEGAGDKVVFRVLVDNEIHTIKQTITYEDDAIVGSIRQPYVIQLDATTEVENTTISSAHIYAYDGILYVEGATEDYKVYDVLGRRMYQGRAPQLRLSNGVYLVQLGEETQQVVL